MGLGREAGLQGPALVPLESLWASVSSPETREHGACRHISVSAFSWVSRVHTGAPIVHLPQGCWAGLCGLPAGPTPAAQVGRLPAADLLVQIPEGKRHAPLTTRAPSRSPSLLSFWAPADRPLHSPWPWEGWGSPRVRDKDWHTVGA